MGRISRSDVVGSGSVKRHIGASYCRVVGAGRSDVVGGGSVNRHSGTYYSRVVGGGSK